MNNTNKTEGWPDFLWRLFYLHTPLGKLVFIILAIVFASFYFKICTWPPTKTGDCNDRVTLVGTLLDAKTKKVLENVIVHLGTFAKDPSLVGGRFAVEGVTLPESKIVPVTVEFSNGERISVEEFDLNNTVKYPIRNCIIDLREIFVDKNSGGMGQSTPGTTHPAASGQPTRNASENSADPQHSSATSFFNEEKPSEVAILIAGQSGGVSFSNLKNRLAQQFQSNGFSTATTLFRPAFLSTFSKNLDDEDLVVLKNAGLDKRCACLCFVRAGKVEFGKDKLEAGGESHDFEKASSSFEVKFFAFRSNVVRSFTIAETGAGGNQSRARESLEEKFMSQFLNQKLPLQLCKK